MKKCPAVAYGGICLNRARFHAHFDKDGLLDYVASESFEQALSSKLPPRVNLNAANLQLFIQIVGENLEEVLVNRKTSIRTQFDSLIEQRMKQQLYRVLSAWLSSPTFRRTTSRDDAELCATMASWAIYGLAIRWRQGERKESAAEFAQRALPLIMAGLDWRSR